MTNETPSTPEAAAKLPWAAPAMSEIDYTETLGGTPTSPFTADGPFYS